MSAPPLRKDAITNKHLTGLERGLPEEETVI
jgi:hypothetical protein